MKSSPIPEPIKIGIPSNNRISQDCKPLFELLKLEGPQDKQTSPYVPNVVFRSGRVNDIAQFLRKGIFEFGILGDDTAIENGLVYTGQRGKPEPIDANAIYIGEDKYLINTGGKVSTFNLPETNLVLFAKPENLEGINFPYELLAKGKMATPYPRTAESILSRLYMRIPELLVNQGGTESIVANGDGKVILGYDVMRTGETIKGLGLVPWKSTVKSYPGLWKSPAIENERREQARKIRDILKDILGDYIREKDLK